MSAELVFALMFLVGILILLILGVWLVARLSEFYRVPKRVLTWGLLALTAIDLALIAFAALGVTPGSIEWPSARAATAKHEIHLSWGAPSQSSTAVAGYNIYRSSDGGKSFAKVNDKPDPKSEYTDRAVASGATYVYVVRSVDAKGAESGPSNPITLKVP